MIAVQVNVLVNHGRLGAVVANAKTELLICMVEVCLVVRIVVVILVDPLTMSATKRMASVNVILELLVELANSP